MDSSFFPDYSLRQGCWFKLICGASYQELPIVRNLSLIYTLAGADCIDVACDPAVIAAAQEGVAVAAQLSDSAKALGFNPSPAPWLMVSLNDGEDPHFRKAGFDPQTCPADCARPCIASCPAQAIAFDAQQQFGVIDARCYGCGRCLPVCPQGLIFTRSYVSTPSLILKDLRSAGIAALEIHTQVGHTQDFLRVWQEIRPFASQLKLLAISCPDHAQIVDYLGSLAEIIEPLPCLLLWQLDGRPMSGDIGKGTTHAAIRLAQKVQAAGLPGYLQLAGGTNGYTVPKLRAMGLLGASPSNSSSPIAGVAYGSYARSLLLPLWEQWAAIALVAVDIAGAGHNLEDSGDLLWEGVKIADRLVSPLKPLPASSR